jgi:hypothetical protein
MHEACGSMILVENLGIVQKTILVSYRVRLWTNMQVSLVLQLLA